MRLRAAALALPVRCLSVGLPLCLTSGLALAALAGCDDASRAPFSIEVVTPAGTSPVAGATTGRLRVIVAQDGQPTRDQGVDLSGGTFQLDVTIASYASPTRLGVELVRDGVTSLGAVPSFAPIGFGFVRIPVVPAGTCSTLATQRLSTARSGAAVVSVDALLAVVGGLAGDGTPAVSAERFWAPQLTATQGSGPLLARELPVGPARGARFAGQPRVLVLSAGRVFVLDFGGDVATDQLDRDVVGLHAGVGERSALVDLGGSGLALVGGASEGAAVASVSWIASDRSAQTSSLPDGRSDATVISWGAGEGILVAGGNADGAPSFAYVPAAPASREAVLSFGPTTALHGGALLRAPDQRAALYVGAIDESGVVTTDTWLVRGCPSACEIAAGPSWPDARERFAVAATATGAWLVGGREGTAPTATVDRVVWSGSTPSFETTTLVTPREDAAVTPLAGGMVLVLGGRGADRALEDLELCAPGSLETL